MGLSLAKLIFTVLAIIGIWTIFRLIQRKALGRRPQTPAERGAEAARRTTRARASGATRARASGETDSNDLDLVRCPDCGAFVPQGTPCACQKRPS
ncbi:hypothetical protein [Rhodospirillum rubrum]|uniref:Uncharacterized protein n=1 Tax=Rhodospirillum rubrum (strain ATCC 11170 / ATH 1.1.1 / DSM 467 / LMG 4362 / NCIMB 8255 / S1) TaxID=269796 RepID=Q2RQ45_RHORT|nr:hypothetical protein [Rhodospirillum rubrum]ABC23750.1 hypothetical protein Rru_A2953 [Rhodospirillum rubrum ATCC 11170]AEO49489.1 hypothetical protein F11_15135 [Rhodospirillum rubrum F11]MBK5955430.1 hypothetical protein [Rhodospirillum rubrum]QXG79704.1 hypothetical protein KUL73_15235 [Rhodospirillum rubrum]HAQ00760.1 hypothetical protein [Rhodospirillum rubrum]